MKKKLFNIVETTFVQEKENWEVRQYFFVILIFFPIITQGQPKVTCLSDPVAYFEPSRTSTMELTELFLQINSILNVPLGSKYASVLDKPSDH